MIAAKSEKREGGLTNGLEPRSVVLTQKEPDLGVLRTMMAADRTLMAWIRTSLSMLSFGYTIYKVLQEVKELGNVVIRDAAPRRAGILLTVAGTAALVMGIVEYLGTLRMLRKSYPFGLARASLIMSMAMAVAGVLLCAGIATKLL